MNEILIENFQGPKIYQLKKYFDTRGYFFENYRENLFSNTQLKFVQDNISYSKKGVLRGMHYQKKPGQAKLVSVIKGNIYDVIVDIRKESPTYKKWAGIELSEENNLQLLVPNGFAHGFFVLSDDAIVTYKVTSYFDAEQEKTFRYDDSKIGIVWPQGEKILSPKDKEALNFEDL